MSSKSSLFEYGTCTSREHGLDYVVDVACEANNRVCPYVYHLTEQPEDASVSDIFDTILQDLLNTQPAVMPPHSADVDPYMTDLIETVSDGND